MKDSRYVAFLRGINVGGNKKVPMAELKTLMERHGFSEVKTLLASGNICFNAKEQKLDTLQPIVEKHFGFTTDILIFNYSIIQEIIRFDPFRGVKMHDEISLYVTFYKNQSDRAITIPYTSEDKSFKIISSLKNVIFSVLDLNFSGTTDAMKILEKHHGKKITTRNYNTILKIGTL